ncbi:MAG TPA: hypothetical protein VG452_00730 [Egibacteraceae bacterium]|nr:hypothetical protein [Egibacteraceae bacterium]
MAERRGNPWYVREVDPQVVQRLAATIEPHPRALEMGVDIVGDPHREDDEGYNWTRLRYARNIADVAPGSVVVMGSRIGTYLAKVVAWDFEVSDDDPIVTLDLLPVTPDAVQRALARSRTSAV